MLSFCLEYLSMAFRKSGKPGLLFCFDSLGKNLLKRTLLLCSFYVWVDCILRQNAFNRLIVYEFGFVLQLGKIVASIEQKPVSLNDIVTCGALIKTESDF